MLFVSTSTVSNVFELLYVVISNKLMGKFEIHQIATDSIHARKLLHIVLFSLLDAPNLHGSSKDINHPEEYLVQRGDIEITCLYCERDGEQQRVSLQQINQ